MFTVWAQLWAPSTHNNNFKIPFQSSVTQLLCKLWAPRIVFQQLAPTENDCIIAAATGGEVAFCQCIMTPYCSEDSQIRVFLLASLLAGSPVTSECLLSLRRLVLLIGPACDSLGGVRRLNARGLEGTWLSRRGCPVAIAFSSSRKR